MSAPQARVRAKWHLIPCDQKVHTKKAPTITNPKHWRKALDVECECCAPYWGRILVPTTIATAAEYRAHLKGLTRLERKTFEADRDAAGARLRKAGE